MGRRRSGVISREYRRCRLGVYFNRNAPGHQQPKVFEAADEVGCSVASSSASDECDDEEFGREYI